MNACSYILKSDEQVFLFYASDSGRTLTPTEVYLEKAVDERNKLFVNAPRKT